MLCRFGFGWVRCVFWAENENRWIDWIEQIMYYSLVAMESADRCVPVPAKLLLKNVPIETV